MGGSAVALAATSAGAQTTTTAGDTTTTVPATTTTEVPKAPTAEDLEILGFAQSLELALVEVYGAALATGKLAEDVLPVVAAFRDHHLQHGQAYAGLAGKAALNTANAGRWSTSTSRASRRRPTRPPCSRSSSSSRTRPPAATRPALAEVRGLNAAATMANILPIESRHAVVLGEALESRPRRVRAVVRGP